MKDMSGNIFCFDGIMHDISDSKLLANNSCEDLRIYEVVRIIDQVPLFLEDHFLRLKASAQAKNLNLALSLVQLKEGISQVVSMNHSQDAQDAQDLNNCNCMIICFLIKGNFHYMIYVRKHYYPSSNEYLNGVKVEMLEIERCDPNIKYIDERYNALTNQAKAKPGVFEVLLVNNQGFITEASKSNVFFIKGGAVITPPAERVLMGVTRKHVIEAVLNCGVELIEADLSKISLKDCDGLFLSGTSIQVLPVSSVRDINFSTSTDAIFLKIKNEFEKAVLKYIKKDET